ncbi:MAG TPA: energy transducer TonB [Vicinamibacterales bacterium]|nr:energy transducer TonB [Vicinamibacterales bacterium]
MTLRPSHRFAITLAWAMAMASATLIGQDSLTRAKDFYASAAYEEALAVLDKLHTSTAAIDSTEVAAYQVFCLVALGRSDEATKAIETMVKSDPLFHPSDTQASPRVRAFFENVRRPLLPDIVRDSYAKGKDAFARKDMAAATAEFDQVIALIDEIGASADPGLADMRTLAAGFRDLSKVPEPAPTPTPTPTPNSTDVAAPQSPNGPMTGVTPPPPSASPAADANRVYTAADLDVTKPVAVSKTMPMWNPDNPVDKMRDFRGTLEVLIDEAGNVKAAALTKSVNSIYDPQLVRAAASWKFRPATRGGVPVKYRYAMDIHLGK